MFMPETEDMLPRAAPRPSAPVPLGHTSEVVMPTVPEVSILFGQHPPQQQQQQQPQQQQQQTAASVARPIGSFASWKKQILPRVNFSPVLTTELGPAPSPSPTASTAAISTPPASNDYNYLPRSRAFEADRPAPMQTMANSANIAYASTPPTAHYVRETYHTDAIVPPARLSNSNPHPPAASAVSDVLTICAGTQTDADTMSARRDAPGAEFSDLANKQDLRELLDLVNIMRQEQLQLRRLCESLVQQQQQANAKTYKETATQCEIVAANKNNAMVKRTTPIVHDYIVEEDEVPATYEKPARVLPQFQSPRAASPMAQSTGYRPNTPQGKQATTPMPPAAATSKPSTEKSLVMSELALKYLPQKQINELMDELRLSPKTTAVNEVASNTAGSTTPLRQIDNFTQSPSNMSNASYKYLKKYRLLPEEQMAYDHQLQRTGSPGGKQHAMLDLDNIRNQPKLI
ncbi:hypothetical protein KR222_003556 [Zaprionus bogoriensis]|nr:hypothetical protein KR222_003556 [Zaprionus bogoriensis]